MTQQAAVAINLIGFDSAWGDNPIKPGAICALRLEHGEPVRFDAPRLVSFSAALDFVVARHRPPDLTIVAIDQPTIVPNDRGARPVEPAVASLMSWSGGGIQPAYRGKAAMFGDGAPIWRFLDGLGYRDDPQAIGSDSGAFVMEVFPAAALLSLDAAFTAGPKCGPRYNPSRHRTFRLEAWRAAVGAVAREARLARFADVVAWCAALDLSGKPRKAVQDCLDSLICLLVAARWLMRRESCVMIGDLATGYIVTPATAEVRARLQSAAETRSVPFSWFHPKVSSKE